MGITWTDAFFLALCSVCAGVLWWFLGGIIGAQSHHHDRWSWDLLVRARFLARHLRVFSAETIGGHEAEFIDDRPVDLLPALPWIARGLLCLAYLSVLCLWYVSKAS